MEMTGLSNSIIEFLFLTSAIVFILGLLCCLVLQVLKIQGKPKLWIYVFLLIFPLSYPINALFPTPIRVSIPLKAWQFLDSHLIDTTAGEEAVSNDVSLIAANTASEYQTEDKEARFIGHAASISNVTVQPIKAVPESSANWKLVATLVWLLVFLCFLIRLVTMVYNINRFSKHQDPVTNPDILKLLRKCAADTGLHRTPRLLTLDRLSSPMVMGYFRPRILLPKHLLKPEYREGLRFTLLHELKHIHQHHNWWLLIESIIGAAYFFHPVIFWAKKRIHEEMEHICDRHVVHITNKSISYADFLLHEIWQRNRGRNLELALPFISGRKKMTHRVRSILEDTRPSMFAQIRSAFALGFFFFSFVSLLLCNVAPSAQDHPEKILYKTTPEMSSAQDIASFHIHADRMEKETPSLSNGSDIFQEVDASSFMLSTEQPSFDNTDDFWQKAASNVSADAHKDDTLTVLKETPRHKTLLERKGAAILLDETGTLARKKADKRAISDPIQSAPKFTSNPASKNIILIAQNDSAMTFASASTPEAGNKKAELNTENGASYIRQGTAYYLQGRLDKAIADYSKAIEINSKSAVAYNNRGSAYLKKGELRKAISDFDKAIEIIPVFAAAYANRGYVFFMRNRYVQAVSDYSKAIELDPANAVVYYNRGNTYYKIGLIDKAISDFNMAINLDPEYIAKMPEGIIPVHKKEDMDYASDVAESLKWIHGSLPLHYWNEAKSRNADSGTLKLYQIKKKGI